MSIFDLHIRLGVLAFLAENKLINKAIKMVLKLGGFMGAVDNPAVVSGIIVSLRSKLEPEIFDDICNMC